MTYSVAQVSKPAVSRISKSASALTKDGLPPGKWPLRRVGNPALNHRISARLHLVLLVRRFVILGRVEKQVQFGNALLDFRLAAGKDNGAAVGVLCAKRAQNALRSGTI